jgi:hypothetical protein
MTYVVRRLKPKLIVFITTGTFNLLSKILTTLRLSGAVWIEAWRLAPSVLELVRRLLTAFAFASASDRRERLCQNTFDLVFLSTLLFSLFYRAAHHR